MPTPANDDWANAILVTGSSGSTTGDNTDATSQGGEPIPSDGPGDGPWQSIWWKWIAPSSGNYYFSTQGSRMADTSSLDTVLAIYRGSTLPGLIEVAANDDFYGDVDGGNSRANFLAQGGVTYFIQVSGYQDVDFGSIALSWASFTYPSPPSFTSPSSGDTIVVEGEGADGVTVSWTPAGDQWQVSVTTGSSGPFDTAVNGSSGYTETTTNFGGSQLPYVSQTLYLWVRRFVDSNGVWSTWTSIPINVVVRVDPTLGCFEQEALVDNPTGLWMPGMLDHRIIADLSGNDRDLVEEWEVHFIGDAYHSDYSSQFASFTPWFNTGAIFPGQHMVAFIMATDTNQGAPGTAVPPPTIEGPYLWSGAITTPGWSQIGSTSSFTWSFVLTGTTINCTTTMMAFHYIVTGHEDPNQIIYWKAAGISPFSTVTHGRVFGLDLVYAFGDNTPLPLTIKDVVFASTNNAPVNWPSFTPPSERYITLNVALTAFGGFEPGYDATHYLPTGTSFPFPNPAASGADALRTDWHFEDEAPPTRGFTPDGSVDTALGLCTIVFGGADAVYWTAVADEPFCTSCGPSRLGSLQSTLGRHVGEFNAFTTTASALDLYGGTAYDGGTYHSFTLELVAKLGEAPSVFNGVTVGGIEIDSPSWLTPAPQLEVGTPGAGYNGGSADVKCWHHFVFTYDHATTTSKFYLDDEIVSTLVHTAYPPGDSSGGADMFAFKGSRVAAYAVYDHVLTRTRVNAHFNQLCFLCAENTWTVKTNRKPGTTEYLSHDARIDRLRKRNRA